MKQILKKYRKIIYIPICLLIIIGLYFGFNILTGKADDSGDRIHFVRSEEGDAIIVESNGHCGLVDALDPVTYPVVENADTCELSTQSTTPNTGQYGIFKDFGIGNGITVKNYAENIGCEYFDFVVMTHSHKDHIGGIPLLKDMFNENTIVFYKEDLKPKDDYEDSSNTCNTYDNHEYQKKALTTFTNANSIMCDVTKASTLNNPKCNLSTLHNKDKNNVDFISSVSYDANDAFASSTDGYDTNVKENLSFDFGDFHINLYSLYNLSQHKEDLNSIVTLITHKNGKAKALLTGDIKNGPFDTDNEDLSNYSNLIENPTGNCTKCVQKGLDNQIADVIGGKVDLLKASDHGRNGSNSKYSLDIYQPKYYITTGGTYKDNGSYSNIVVMTYLKHKYETKSYYATYDGALKDNDNNPKVMGGAVVAQFNDNQSDNLKIMSYDSFGNEVKDSLEDKSTITSYKNLSNQPIIGKIALVNKNSNDFVYGFLDNNGTPLISQTGTYTNGTGTAKYYLDENGLIMTGFYSDWFNDKYYLSDSNDNTYGEVLTGLQDISVDDSNYLFYFRPTQEAGHDVGSMVTGFYEVDGKKYYFRTTDDDISEGPQGSAVSGEVEIDGYTYYFYEDSENNDFDSELQYSMLKNGSVVINGVAHHYDSEGHLIETTNDAVSIPTSNSCNAVVYDGTEQVIADDGEFYTVLNATGTNASEYTVTAVINPGYVWQDKTTSNKTFKCTIEKSEVHIEEENQMYEMTVGDQDTIISLTPEFSGTFNLTKESNKINFAESSKHVGAEETFNIVVTGVKVGTEKIQITFTPDDANYTDTVFDLISLKVKSNGTSTLIPTSENYCKSDLVYNGEQQILTNDPGTGYTFINNSKTNASKYLVQAKLENGYKWEDETIDNKNIACSIKKVTPTITKTNDADKDVIVGNTKTVMTVSSDTPGTFTYIADDKVQIDNLQDKVLIPDDTKNIEVTGVKGGRSIVTVIFTPDDRVNYDIVEFTINDIEVVSSSIPIPTSNTYCNKNLVYNGSSQTLATPKYDSVTLSQNTAINAGSHEVTASLNDNSVTWGDGTTTSKTFNCTIAKADPTISIGQINVSNIIKGQTNNILSLISSTPGRFTFVATNSVISEFDNEINVTANQNATFTATGINVGSGTLNVSFIPTDTLNYNTYIADPITLMVVTTQQNIAQIPTSSTACKSNVVYNGQLQTLTNNPGEGYTFSNNTQTNAGEYNNVTATLNNGYTWSDGTTENKTVTCSIAKFNPTITVTNEINELTAGSSERVMTLESNEAGSFTYQGDEYITVENATDYTFQGHSVDLNAHGNKKGVGTITITFTPVDDSNINSYQFTKNVTINGNAIPLPTSDNYCIQNLVYNGSSQTLASSPNSSVTLSDNTGINATTYTVVASINDNTLEWADGTTTSKNFTCTISKADPTVTVNSINTSNVLQYSNNEILSFTPSVSGEFTFTAGSTVIKNYQSNALVNADETFTFSAEGLTVGSTTLYVTFTPENTNYNSYNNSYPITVVENTEHVVSVPTQDSVCLNSIIYNGTEQTLTVDDSIAYEFINNKKTDAGNYDVTVKLKGDYKWSDNTTTDKTVTCSIEKASLNVPAINGYIGTYDGNPHHVNVSTIPGATIMYSTDNDNWSSEEITRTNVGTTTVYIKYVGDSNHNNSSTYSVDIIIEKAIPVISTSNLAPHVNAGGEAEVGPISSNVAGIFTITSADTSILTVPTIPKSVLADESIKFTINGVSGGTTSYTITFTPGSDNYDTKSLDPIDISVDDVIVAPVSVPKPTSSEYCISNLKYTGSPLTITKEPVFGFTFSNNVQTNVGTYTVTATLDSGIVWDDDSTTDVTFNCSILPADGYINFNSKLIEGNGYIRINKNPPTTFTQLKSLIDTNGVITHTKNDTDVVATCDTLTVNLNGLSKIYTLVVPGDITKNGNATNDDVNLLFNYLRNKATLNTCQLKASDTTNDNSVHINDVAKLYQYVNHKIEGLGE